MSTAKKTRTIPPEHLCPVKDCGGRMKFTHSVPRADGTITKRRKCKFCGYEDRAVLRVEVVKLLEVHKDTMRYRTLDEKTADDNAISHTSTPKNIRQRKPKRQKLK